MIPVYACEQSLQGWIARRSRPLLRPLVALNVVLGGEGVVHLLGPAAVLALRGTQQAVAVTAAMALAPVVEAWLKELVHRGRPRDEGEPGFPSGDCMAVAIWSAPLLGWWAAIPIGLVVWARMARDAHWPLDCLAGVTLGLWLASPALLLFAVAWFWRP